MDRKPLAPEEWLDVFDAESAARAVLSREIWDFLEGGAEQESSFRLARAAFERYALVPQVLTGAERPRLETTILGMPSRAPILVAPVGRHALFHPEAESAVARGVAAHGLPAVFAMHGATPFTAITRDSSGWAVQLYPLTDRGLMLEILASAIDAGASAAVLTVDAAATGRRLRDMRNGTTRLRDVAVRPGSAATEKLSGIPLSAAILRTYTWDDVAKLVQAAGRPVAVKGILSAADALRAADAGVHTVWVSSHGGRQLDYAVPPLDALGRIADALDGRAEIVVDTGVRCGADVVKALSRGARAVAFGRVAVWGLAAGSAEGVAKVFELLLDQLENTLIQLGVSDVAALGPDAVVTVPCLHHESGTPVRT